jgi:hypothetical protein
LPSPVVDSEAGGGNYGQKEMKMNGSRRPPKTVVAFCVATVICVAQAAIPARAEDAAPEKILKPLAGISFGVGSKRVVGYFVADARACNLTLMLGDSIANDEVPTSSPMRIRQTIAPDGVARVDTNEGESFEFGCKSDAGAMSVRMLTAVAVYK